MIGCPNTKKVQSEPAAQAKTREEKSGQTPPPTDIAAVRMPSQGDYLVCYATLFRACFGVPPGQYRALARQQDLDWHEARLKADGFHRHSAPMNASLFGAGR